MSLAVIQMPACKLWVSVDAGFTIVTGSTGAFATTLPVPGSASLLGAALYGQALAPDPAANPTGVATTGAFEGVIGL